MANITNEISIKGLKHIDLLQLEEIFHHFKDEGIYYGRKDYFDARMGRLEAWLRKTNDNLQSQKIGKK